MRRPLSAVEEEPHFLAADDACDRIAALLVPHIRAMHAVHAAKLKPYLELAAAYASPSAVRIGWNRHAAALDWTNRLMTSERGIVAKARRTEAIGANEGALIDEAVDAGIELGLKTLPAKARREVDVESARELTRKRLIKGTFRQNLAALNETQRGLDVIVGALRSPSLSALRDPGRLASMFGLNAQQARSLVREYDSLYNYGPKNTPARLASLWRSLKARIHQALEARYEVLGQTLAREAVATAQQALYETALRQGLLDAERQVKEWVARWVNTCPRCGAFDGQRAPIDGMFVSDDGEKAFQPGIHPRCRCTVRLVTLRSRARTSRRRAA